MNRLVAVAVGLIVVSLASAPWAFGAVTPGFERALLGALLVALALGLVSERGLGAWPDLPLFPVAALLSLPLLQLLPLPEGLARALAPGPAQVWHPGLPAAAEALGSSFSPVSLHPQATARAFLYSATLLLLALRLGPWLASEQRYRIAVPCLVAATLGLAGYALFARSAFGNQLYGRIAVPTIAPFGPFVSKNHFAGFVEVVALIALGAAFGIADREKRVRGAAWAEGRGAVFAVLLFSAGLALAVSSLASGSRGGAVALVAGLFGLLGLRIQKARNRRVVVASALAFALVAGLALASAPSEVQSRWLELGAAHQEVSGAYRLDVWRDTLRLSLSSPAVGSGFGAFAEALPRFKSGHGELRVERAENDLLEWSAEGGLAALALLAWLVWSWGRHLLASLESCSDRRLRGAAQGALAGLLALAAHSLLDFNLRIPSNGALAAFALGLALAPARLRVLPTANRAAAVAVLGLSLLAARLPISTPRPDLTSDARGSLSASPEIRELKRHRLEASLVRAVQDRPAAPEHWLLWGWLEALRGNRPAATELLSQARALDPRQIEISKAAQRILGSAPSPKSSLDQAPDAGR